MSALELIVQTEQRKTDGNSATVPIQVLAIVPCLRGGLHTNLRTSVGAIETSKPGDPPYALFLSPMGTTVLSEQVSGEANLTLPSGRVARIDAEIGETTTAITVGPF